MALAATESVEVWILDVMEKAGVCAIHRGSYTVKLLDILLVGRCSGDLTMRGTVFAGYDSDKYNAIGGHETSATGRGGKPLVELLAEIDVVTQERIIRKLARRSCVTAYDGSAYDYFWRLILLRLCVLLGRVDAVFMHSWEDIESRPSLETLAHVLQNGSGPIDPPPPCVYTQLVGDEDDGSFGSDDCPDTDDDDDSSIGDESAPPSSVTDRLASLASLHARGALSEAEFARAKALELGLPAP